MENCLLINYSSEQMYKKWCWNEDVLGGLVDVLIHELLQQRLALLDGGFREFEFFIDAIADGAVQNLLFENNNLIY